MNRKHYIYGTIIAMIMVFLFSRCAAFLTGYGKIRPQPWHGERVTIQELQENWKDYTIYYAGLSVGTVAGIIFDPKNDKRTLTGDKWIKVEDKETLSELISWMETYTAYNPQIWRILGPGNELYGYLYYPQSYEEHAVAKVVNDTTMYVYDLQSPRYPKRCPFSGT
jgi:hypothetical protein